MKKEAKNQTAERKEKFPNRLSDEISIALEPLALFVEVLDDALENGPKSPLSKAMVMCSTLLWQAEQRINTALAAVEQEVGNLYVVRHNDHLVDAIGGNEIIGVECKGKPGKAVASTLTA